MAKDPFLFNELVTWFNRTRRDLPWRHPRTTPWGILVCEIMSHQTPVERVMGPWQAWMHKWPSPRDLAEASPAEILIAWNNLGYPRRALRLQECAYAIQHKYAGKVPASREELLSLPGIGPYTADAILTFAFHQRAVVLDVNIRRVLCRWRGVPLPSGAPRSDEIAQADKLVPQKCDEAVQWNSSLMEFGAIVCTNRHPHCDICPVRTVCQWYAAGKPQLKRSRAPQKFRGTHREARGLVMECLRSSDGPVQYATLQQHTALTPQRLEQAISSLLQDGLAVVYDEGYGLPTQPYRATSQSI